jgi:hypothetical protein
VLEDLILHGAVCDGQFGVPHRRAESHRSVRISRRPTAQRRGRRREPRRLDAVELPAHARRTRRLSRPASLAAPRVKTSRQASLPEGHWI